MMMVVGKARAMGEKDWTPAEARAALTLLTHCWQNMPSTARVMVRSESDEEVPVANWAEDVMKEHSKPASSIISATNEVGREARWVTVAEDVRTETSHVEIQGCAERSCEMEVVQALRTRKRISKAQRVDAEGRRLTSKSCLRRRSG